MHGQNRIKAVWVNYCLQTEPYKTHKHALWSHVELLMVKRMIHLIATHV